MRDEGRFELARRRFGADAGLSRGVREYTAHTGKDTIFQCPLSQKDIKPTLEGDSEYLSRITYLALANVCYYTSKHDAIQSQQYLLCLRAEHKVTCSAFRDDS